MILQESNAGWCFKLPFIPELGLNTFTDWKEFLADNNILDDRGRALPLRQLMRLIGVRFYSVRHIEGDFE